MTAPVICFGQQPCGFFPKRFLVAKLRTAARLQREIGGTVVFFDHDADHDPRETRTVVRHRDSGRAVQLNFEFENKVQRKHSPLYLKRVPQDWRRRTAQALPNYVDKPLVAAFEAVAASPAGDTAGGFCLAMYRRLGHFDPFGDAFRVVRSGDPAVRRAACDVADFFVDVPHDGEVVRARSDAGRLTLHEGGDRFTTLPPQPFDKSQVSPTRDSRLVWMQSVVGCTHYVCGAGERQYLDATQTPDVQFVSREDIDRSDEAYTDIP